MKDLVFKLEDPILSSKENSPNGGNVLMKTNSNKLDMDFATTKTSNYMKNDPMVSKCTQRSKSVSARPMQIKYVYCGICQGLLDNKSLTKTMICTHKFHSVRKFVIFFILI